MSEAVLYLVREGFEPEPLVKGTIIALRTHLRQMVAVAPEALKQQGYENKYRIIFASNNPDVVRVVMNEPPDTIGNWSWEIRDLSHVPVVL